MQRGEKARLLETGKFDTHIRELISRICGKNNVNAVGPKLQIMTFLEQPSYLPRQKFCTDCGEVDIKFSRSGRTIFAPMRLEDEIYVSGSSIGGCDHYDHGYDRGEFVDLEHETDANLKDFVVDDEPSDQEKSDSEEEWNDSSSEEDSDSDRDWD